jgi:DNA-binding NarL/FixJ family response regulator
VYRLPVPPPASILLAAAHAPFRAGLRAALGRRFAVVGEAASVAGLARLLATVTADALLLDEALEGGGAAAALTLPGRPATVVVFVDAAEPAGVAESYRRGATGFLLKDMAGSELRPAVEEALAGRPVVAPALLHAVLAELGRRRGSVRRPDGDEVRLTAREQEVASLLRRRYTTRAIADELGINVVTVRRHVSKLQQKLGVASRGDALAVLES